jgi:hypothetical protein
MIDLQVIYSKVRTTMTKCLSFLLNAQIWRVDKNVTVQPRTRILQNITLKALFTQAILCD